MTHYDAVVIGAGQGGDPLARSLAAAGQKVALIERDQVGGTCVNTGCTPTKTMAASAQVAYLARRAAEFGVHLGGPVTVRMDEVRARKQGIVESFRAGTEGKIEATPDLTLLRGAARFTGPLSLDVISDGVESLTAGRVIINTGARAAVPPVDGLADVPFLTWTSMEELETVPPHLLILGGGYIACEFGQMFRRFGSEVTIVQSGHQLLDREDPDIAETLAGILREDGITVLLGAKATRAAQEADGSLVLTVQDKDGLQVRTGSHLLVATGRTPNTDDFGLDQAGINTDSHGFIEVNERLETNVPNVYAIGDVKGGPAFTHISYDDYRIVKDLLLGSGKRTTQDRPVPYTVFTDPQLGRVGLSETEARAQGYAIKVATLPMSEVARGIETGQTRGVMKAVVDADTDQILGAAILSLDGGEVMAVLEVAMLGKLPYTALRDGVFAHPTLAESLNNLFMTLDT